MRSIFSVKLIKNGKPTMQSYRFLILFQNIISTLTGETCVIVAFMQHKRIGFESLYLIGNHLWQHRITNGQCSFYRKRIIGLRPRAHLKIWHIYSFGRVVLFQCEALYRVTYRLNPSSLYRKYRIGHHTVRIACRCLPLSFAAPTRTKCRYRKCKY